MRAAGRRRHSAIVIVFTSAAFTVFAFTVFAFTVSALTFTVSFGRTEASGIVVTLLLRIVAGQSFAVTALGARATIAAIPAFAIAFVAFILPTATPVILATAAIVLRFAASA